VSLSPIALNKEKKMQKQAISEKKPIDYVKIIFRRKWLVIIPIVIGLIGGVILVEEGRIINPLVQDLAVSTSTASRLNVLREQILGWDRINQLIATLNLAKDVRTQLQYEELVKRLRKSIIVRLHTSHNIVSISYEGKDPLEAKNIVKTITDIFIAENLRQQNQETENAIAFINDQLGLYLMSSL
jgi:uncharacterized protein involved in exopolysaccharide biosynthesis